MNRPQGSVSTIPAALAGVLALALSAPGPDQGRRIDLEAADCSSVNMMFGDYEIGPRGQLAPARFTAFRVRGGRADSIRRAGNEP